MKKMQWRIRTLLIIQLAVSCSTFIAHIPVTSDEVLIYINLKQAQSYSQRQTDNLPENIKASFNLDGETVELHLQKNPNIHDHVPVLLRRHSYVRKYRLTPTERVALYGDKWNEASFLIVDKRHNSIEQQQLQMFGTLLIKNETYLVQPPNTELESRHLISKMKNKHSTEYDNVNPLYSDETKHSRGRNSDVPVNGPRVKRQTAGYEIEILIAVDYSIYSFWYNKTTGTDSERTILAINSIRQFYSFVINAINLRYQSVVDRSFTIECLFAGIYIADTASGASFVEDNIYAIGSGNVRSQVVGSVILSSFKSWANENLNGSFEYDHAMLFSGYDFITVTSGNVQTSLAGVAYLGGLCDDNRYSVNEDHFDASLATVAAHELGHNLNSDHDGDGNTCLESDGFIMAASSITRLTGSSFNKGQWVFSTCSLDYFENFISSLDSGASNCMTNRSQSFNVSALEEFTNDTAGQTYGPDYQCEENQGTGSFLFRSFYDGNFSRICEVLACADPSNTLSYSGALTWEGTSCGNGQICQSSNCMNSSGAPSGLTVIGLADSCFLWLCRNGSARLFLDITEFGCQQSITSFEYVYKITEGNKVTRETNNRHINLLSLNYNSCLFGNVPYNVPGSTFGCSAFLGNSSTSYRCYTDLYKHSCCESCEVHRVNNAGLTDCEFGDKASWCATLSRTNCYSNDAVCCSICNSLASTNTGCKYGDRSSGCVSDDCDSYDENSRTNLCCETCATTTIAPTQTATSQPQQSTSTTQTTIATTTEISATTTSKTTPQTQSATITPGFSPRTTPASSPTTTPTSSPTTTPTSSQSPTPTTTSRLETNETSTANTVTELTTQSGTASCLVHLSLLPYIVLITFLFSSCNVVSFSVTSVV